MIEILRPNAPGDETNCIIGGDIPAPTNWESVGEVVADDPTTYVRAQLLNGFYRDLYNILASVGRGTINSVTVWARVYQGGDLPFSAVKIALKTGGVVYESALKTVNNLVWENHSEAWAINPETGIAWTWEEIDALQIGVSLGYVFRGYVARCTQVYVEVDYTPALAYHLDVTINGEGLVLPEGVSGDYWEGSVIELTASPAAGWWFHSWEGTDNDSVNPTTVTMDSDKHVVCNFTQVAPAGCLPVVAAGILLVAGIIAGIIIAFV